VGVPILGAQAGSPGLPVQHEPHGRMAFHGLEDVGHGRKLRKFGIAKRI
jgi:hypothetical protein